MEEKMVERDFAQEVQELYKACPEMRGEELPTEVAQTCVKEGKNLTEAYKAYAEAKTQAQNTKAAKQAPVRGVTRGGSVSSQPEDAFLRGFNEAW